MEARNVACASVRVCVCKRSRSRTVRVQAQSLFLTWVFEKGRGFGGRKFELYRLVSSPHKFDQVSSLDGVSRSPSARIYYQPATGFSRKFPDTPKVPGVPEGFRRQKAMRSTCRSYSYRLIKSTCGTCACASMNSRIIPIRDEWGDWACTILAQELLSCCPGKRSMGRTLLESFWKCVTVFDGTLSPRR